MCVVPTRCAVPKSRGAMASDPTDPGMRPIGRHSQVVVSSTHVSPCCCLPVLPHITKSCLSTATAQWNARGPGPPTAADGGLHHRPSFSESTTVSPTKLLVCNPPKTTTSSPSLTTVVE